MNIFEFLKLAPKIALFIFPLVLVLLAFAFSASFKSLFKRQGKEPGPAISPLAGTETQPEPPLSSKTPSGYPVLLILTIFLLLLSLPLAVFLVKQRQEIRMRAKEGKEPTGQTTSPSYQCHQIRVYRGDPQWTPIEREGLSKLKPGEVIRITVKGDPEVFDKGRIRINNTEWTTENETNRQKPDSPGEFYLECQVAEVGGRAAICGIGATSEDEFRIEAEVHNATTNEWH